MTQTPIQPAPLYIPPPPAPPPPPKVPPRIQRPPPPPIMVAPSPPVAPRRYPTGPLLVNYRDGIPKQIDYPVESWRNNEEGLVTYRIDIDATGKATDCTIIESSGYPALDAKTCEVVMERATFSPAFEAEGKPVAGSLERSYDWRKRGPDMPEMQVVFEYLHDENGRSSDCKFLKLEGDIPETLRMEIERNMDRNGGCPIPANRAGIPYRDESGTPVAKRVIVTLDVKLEEPSASD